MNATMTRRSKSSEVASPAIDAVQALWAARELEAIINQLGVDSPVAMVLRHARFELQSLTAADSAGTVIGPFRVAA